ncbi:MAG: hypothetical protein PHN31_01980 [Candidatus Gracilibacteria bacterium]|nr:hypothetical protein [Candidatus Gracilibacteria bacterium]
MKKLLLTLILLSFFTVYNYTYSESSDNGRVIATVNIYDAKILSQDNNTIKLQFDLSNREYVQPDIRYAVRLITENGDIIEEKVYDEVVNLNENTDIIKEVEYEAPAYLNGKYEISVIAKNRSGLTLALSRNFEIVLNGSNDYVEINESSCYLKVEGFEEKYNLSQGVDILNEENLIATCKLKNNSDESKKIIPYYKSYLRNGFGDEVNTENIPEENILLNASEEKEFSFKIPNAKLPQAYDVKLSLKDETGKIISNEIIFHYVISGASATIQNVRLDKDSYKKGENALIDIFYSKSVGNFIGARNDFIKDSKLFFGIEIKDSNNNVCISNSEKELTDSTQLNLSLPVINDCINPNIVSYIKDESGKILDKKEYNIKSESIQKKKVFNNTENTSNINLVFISIVFIIVLIVIIYLFKSKKNKNKKKNNTIIQIIFMFMLIGLFIGDNKEVSADSITNSYLVRAGQYRFPGVSQVPHDYTITVNFDKKQYKPGEKVYVSQNTISVRCANTFINSILNVKNNGVQILSKNFNDMSTLTKNIQNISFTAPSTPGTYSLEFELIDNRCRNSTGKNSGWSPSGYDEGPYLYDKTSKLNADAGYNKWTTDSTRAAILASYPNVKAHYNALASIEGVRGNHVYCDKLKTKVVFNYKVVADPVVVAPVIPSIPVVPSVPTTPVAPVVTTSSTTSNGCSSYISSWVTTWSSCNIIGSWNSLGVIKCKQTPSYSPVYSSCGTKTCVTTYTDGVATGTSCTCSSVGCPSNSPIPNYSDVLNNVIASINSINSTCFDLYANDSDTCKLSLKVSSSTLQNKGITGWGSNGSISNIVDKSGEKSDRITNIGDALNFTSVNSSGIPASTSNNFNVVINNIKSRTPFVSNMGIVGIKIGGVLMDLSNIKYSFKKPFVGYLKASNDEGLTWDVLPSLGTKILYKLGATPRNILNDYSLEVNTGSISHLGSNILLEDTLLQSYAGQGPYMFSTRINSSTDATELNNTPGIQISLPIISYDLNGNNVRYYLSEFENGDDTNSVKIIGSNFIGLKVIGELQGNGKAEFTGQEKNISSLSTLDYRTQIRKNAYTYVLNMYNGQILDGVKYVEGNITISGDQDYETLVVKDGNVIIEGDLNQSKKKLGIIVLKDNYDVNLDYINKGNIYVENGVKEINAIIYADGGFISANSLGLPYTLDSTIRTTSLQKQLVVNGNLFTRNTIGGAQYVGGYYLLPGGTKITDFNKAMLYDLNYIRRGNEGCDKNSDLDCDDIGEYNEGLILKYNSKIQTNPPKLFY